MFTKVIITKPAFFDGEAERIACLLRQGNADLLHIRKPGATIDAVERLITAIPAELRNRLVLHDHHSLAMKYNLFGVHLNSRNPLPPHDWHGSVSRSCHSLDEVREWKDRCNYVSLSPIFDSISKVGYHSAFTRDDIAQASARGIIDNKVFALGGVTFKRLHEVEEMGFGGAMILGDAWPEVMKNILTIAGSDTSAGAGIQQDLKTITSLGHYAVTVPTALTAQNTVGVQKVMAVPEDMLEAQLQSVFSDISVAAVKTGMIPGIESARIIVKYASRHPLPLVCDPVMLSTSGTQLMSDECVDYIKKALFPLCALVTPNIPEALRLTDTVGGYDLDLTGMKLVKRYNTAFLLKGGHGDGDIMRDVLFMPDGTRHEYCSPRIATTNLHGTGCTLSSAIATLLATGQSLPEAVKGAKAVIDKGIMGGRSLRIGKGNGPLWLF